VAGFAGEAGVESGLEAQAGGGGIGARAGCHRRGHQRVGLDIEQAVI
jgi:hypothetical protein